MISFIKTLFSKPQPYFPCCPGVITVIPKIIFSSLDDSELAKICRVSKIWYQLVKTTPELNHRLVRTGCLNAAKADSFTGDSICPWEIACSTLFFKKVTAPFLIATIDPRHDFSPFLEAIRKQFLWSSDGKTFSKIVRYICKSDLALAKKISLEFHNNFPGLLLDVVKIESQTDHTNAENTAEHIENLAVKSEAFLFLKKPSRAKAIAENIPEPAQQIRALLKIAKADPSMDLAPIKALASCISLRNNHIRYASFYEIVKVEALRDLAAAKTTVATEDNFEDIEDYASCYKSKAYKAIVRVEIGVNSKQAKITSKLIVNSDIADKAQRKIAKVEATASSAAAKATAEKIRQTSIRCKTLIEIVKKEALVDLASAKKTAQSILLIEKEYGSTKNPRDYADKAFLKIIEIEACQNLSNARKTIKMIESSCYKALAMAEVAKHDSKHDFRDAKAEAKKLEHELDSSRLLYKIALAELLFNSTNAMATALEITNPYYRFCALIKIGKRAQKFLK